MTGEDLRPGGTGTITLEEWDQMGDGERAKLFASDREGWQSMIDATRKRGEARLFGGESARGAVGTDTVTFEGWNRMGDAERLELYRSDRELWQAMIDATRKRGEARLLGVGA
jgi:hypothetical protein